MLRQHREREIVAVAAAVAGLEIVAVYIHDRAVGQVAERAANRIGAGVAEHGQDHAALQAALGLALEGDAGAIDRDPVGDDQAVRAWFFLALKV